jgi:hypothetical protein
MVGTNKTALDTKTITEGYVWFTTGDGKFYIDWKDINDGNKLKRSVLNAGHADTATKATQDASGNVITSTYATIATVNGKAPTSHASTATTYGAASASNYGHAMASSTTPKANGTAAVGSETAKFARGDHVHPLQTSVSGSAGSVAWSGVTSKPSYYDAKAIKGISRSGTTFTYTCMDGTTGTFTQQDTNTTYGLVSASANGLAPKFDAADGTINS